MNKRNNKRNNKGNNKRSKLGAVLAEFGTAFALLVVFFFIPLVNMSFIGVRFLIAQGAIQEFVHRVALANKRSDSYDSLASDPSWSQICNSSGGVFTSSNLQLIVCDKNGNATITQANQKIPTELLPGGSKAPCSYSFEMTAGFTIPPIYSANSGSAIPGITSPIQVQLKARSAWENLSQDPITQEFFINE